MILDSIDNISLYKGLGDKVTKALNYLKETDFEKIENGKYELEGKDVIAAVSRYKTKPAEEGKWEAHKNHIDIQFIASGAEIIGYSFLKDMKPKTEYNPEKDVQFFEGEGQSAKALKNTFLILFPTDVHMPGIRINEAEEVIKVVVKVKMQ
ncbi:MAG: YhcH/YjgK/YiaL family protein [Ignavibacteriaceae bacterium]|nr:YhcH/YjgK/YiaL family protein [Ignavibacteriaceae bacterium]